MNELVLGTAQMGSPYGITNHHGRLRDDTMTAMVQDAFRRGVTLLDTAPSYGDAESRLGALAPSGARYITKFTLSDRPPNEEDLYLRSLRRLQADSLHGLLAHRVADLSHPQFGQVLEILRSARSAGLVERFGVSVYDRTELDLAFRIIPDLDIVQVPGNAVDRRLLDDDLVAELHESGVQIHVRSVFLQGLLLEDSERLDSRFRQLVPAIQRFDEVADELRTTRMRVLLGQLKDDPLVDAVLVGATSYEELRQILDSWESNVQIPKLGAPPLGHEILDARAWKVR